MENSSSPDGPPRDGYGPRPAEGTAAEVPRLSGARGALLATLQAQPEPTTIAALVAASGLHPNTVREHLDALVVRKLVRRRPGRASGRGRPAHLYEAIDPPRGSDYAGLASTLAATIHRTSADPVQDAIAAGLEWGRDLARAKGPSENPGDLAARAQVVALLSDLGFAPEADDRQSVVHLTRCPLLETAYRYPDVVCGVHLGIVRGALEEYGTDPSRADLRPFAEPGACRLELMHRDTEKQSTARRSTVSKRSEPTPQENPR